MLPLAVSNFDMKMFFCSRNNMAWRELDSFNKKLNKKMCEISFVHIITDYWLRHQKITFFLLLKNEEEKNNIREIENLEISQTDDMTMRRKIQLLLNNQFVRFFIIIVAVSENIQDYSRLKFIYKRLQTHFGHI